MASTEEGSEVAGRRPARLFGRMFDSVLRYRNFRLFFAGQVVSQLGSWVQKVGQVWFVFDLTHSGRALGILVVCQFIPYTTFGLFGGVICDRLDRYRALLASQATMMLCAGLLAALAFTGSLAVWQVDVLAVAQGTAMLVDTPVRQAFVFQMVGREQIPNAVALNVSVFNLARMVGPTSGGLIIAALGVRLCFLINAISFVAVLVGLLLMRRREFFPVTTSAVSWMPRQLIRDTRNTLRFAWRSRTLRAIVVMVLVTATLGNSFNVTLPILSRTIARDDAVLLGILLGCYGAGALVGALGMAAWSRTSRRALFWSCGLMGTLELLLAGQHAAAGAAVVIACIGVVLSSVTANASATLQLDASDEIRTRMLSLYSYCWVGTAPVNGLIAGWLSDSAGPAPAFLVGGGAMLLVALLHLRPTRGRPPDAA